MSVKKKSAIPNKKPANAPKPITQSAPPAAEAPKKTRKPTVRKPPMDRALKRAKLLDKNASAMLKLVSNWKGDADADQQSTNADIVTNLRAVTKLAVQVLLDVDMLNKSGFAPTEGRAGGGKEPLAAGARVAIKEKHFNAKLYAKNDFEVVIDAGAQVRIRLAGDLRAPQLDVSRNWLIVLDSTDVDDAPEDEAEAVDDDTDQGDNDQND